MPLASYDFSQKVAFVTGGASGIGLAAVCRFAESGAAVVIADVDSEAGSRTESELQSRGAQVRYVELDVTQPESVAEAVAAAVMVYGRIDYAVNSAAVAFADSSLIDTKPEQWRRTMAVNLDGVFLCMQAELRQMTLQGFGVIVNLSSGAGLIGAPMMAAYSASKHAVLGLTRSAARESLPAGIRVNAICPGAIETPMLAGIIPADEVRAELASQHLGGRNGTPEEVAAMILFACSDDASYSTGVEFKVNGGAVY